MMTQVWVSCSSVRIVRNSSLNAEAVEDTIEDEEDDYNEEDEDDPVYNDEEYAELDP